MDRNEQHGGREMLMRTVAVAVALSVVAYLDWYVGPRVSFAIFYLVPIALMAWWMGRGAGFVVSVLAALLWLGVDLSHGAPDWRIHCWNAASRLGFFVIVVVLLSAQRAAATRLREALAVRTAALEEKGEQQKKTERQLADSEERFRQAQKMEAIGRLAGGIAHDFRNQITVILGYCKLASGALRKASPVLADIQEIRQACLRASSTTDQLLAFGRKSMLRPVVADLNRVLEEFRAPLGKVLGEDIILSMVPATDLGMVMVDVQLFQQAVLNLVANARDAMPMGGRLTLETANLEVGEEVVAQHPEARPGPHAMVAVTDTGQGMDKEALDHAFEPFFTTKSAGHGTGLGLAMVYGFVRQSGGYIGIYSERGQGTTIRMFFPRVQGSVDAPSSPTPSLPARGGGERILVVEDEDAVRRLVERVLGAAGYEVVVAANAAEALRRVEEGAQFDLLLTDVVMPEMSGPALVDRLRAQGLAFPVVFMSGYAPNAIVHHGVVNPGVRLVTKPFTAEDITATIREALAARKEPCLERREP